jgi:hypothetical protein
MDYASGSHWDLTPRQSVEQECRRRGETEVVAGCVTRLAGGDAGRDFVYALGGPAADSVLGPHPRGDQRYFLRVWAARALLYAWDDPGSVAPRRSAARQLLDSSTSRRNGAPHGTAPQG